MPKETTIAILHDLTCGPTPGGLEVFIYLFGTEVYPQQLYLVVRLARYQAGLMDPFIPNGTDWATTRDLEACFKGQA